MMFGRLFKSAICHLNKNSLFIKLYMASLAHGPTTGNHWKYGELDGELESISHTLYHCKLLPAAFDVIDTAFRVSAPHTLSIYSDILRNPRRPLGLVSTIY